MFDAQINQYLTKHGFETFCPKAVLFDMDGVLFDSMPNHAHSWKCAMAEYGIEMEPSEAYRYEGMRGVETIKILTQQHWGEPVSDEKAHAMYDTKSKWFRSCPIASKMPGAEHLMRLVANSGLKVVIVTGSATTTLLSRLQKEFPGLIDENHMVTAFDVQRGKPDPQPYIKGLEKAGVNPWEAIVVENAPLGIRSAVAANIFTVAVNTGPLPDKTLQDEGCNLLFNDMPSVETFIDFINNSKSL